MRPIPLIALTALLLAACEQKQETGKEITIPLTLSCKPSGDTADEGVSNLHLWAVNRDDAIVRHYVFDSASWDGKTLATELPYGRYRLAFAANARTPDEIDAGRGASLDDIMLRLPLREDGHGEASPFLTAVESVYVTDNSTILDTVRLFPRTGELRIRISGIPSGISELKLKLFPVPSSASFSGESISPETCIILPLAVSDEIETRLTTFPIETPTAQLFLAYSTDSGVAHKRIPFNTTVDTNQTVRVDCRFNELADEEPAPGDLPGEDAGHGNGINLLSNGSFEQWFDGSEPPDGWHYYRDGRDSAAVKINASPVLHGKQAVRLEGKTYLYQDVEITPGERYEIKMHVNAPHADFSWKYYCYWRKSKSQALPKAYNTPIQSPKYLKQTDGWTNVFEGKTFRAPDEAKLLRIEIRTYGKTRQAGTGVYIDDFSVELVE